MKNIFNGCSNRVNRGKKRINKPVNRLTEITQTKTLREKGVKNKETD